jgi:GNAT superfamily N-acetyltransferase
MTISIRILTDADFEKVNTILGSAFQRAESWLPELRLFCRLQPDGIFLACNNGVPAGMVATILYPEYAYVGLMGIHQDFQRRGLGVALMEHVLSWVKDRNIPLVKLDASSAGQPLYEKLGFVPLDEVCVYQRQIGNLYAQRPKGIQLLTPQNLDLVTASDIQAFGADRNRLLRTLLETYPERAFLSQDESGHVNGYLFCQEKRIGPWIMNENSEAEKLLAAAMNLPYPGAISVIVPAKNHDGASLLQRNGFQIVRANRHMAYGSVPIMGHRGKVFGQTSLSLG